MSRIMTYKSQYCDPACPFFDPDIRGEATIVSAECTLFTKNVAYPAKLSRDVRAYAFRRSPSCIAVEAMEQDRAERLPSPPQRPEGRPIELIYALGDHCALTCPYIYKAGNGYRCMLPSMHVTLSRTPQGGYRRCATCVAVMESAQISRSVFLDPDNFRQKPQASLPVATVPQNPDSNEDDPPTVATLCIDFDEEYKK